MGFWGHCFFPLSGISNISRSKRAHDISRKDLPGETPEETLKSISRLWTKKKKVPLL
jgi:hypothetical protein